MKGITPLFLFLLLLLFGWLVGWLVGWLACLLSDFVLFVCVFLIIFLGGGGRCNGLYLFSRVKILHSCCYVCYQSSLLLDVYGHLMFALVFCFIA